MAELGLEAGSLPLPHRPVPQGHPPAPQPRALLLVRGDPLRAAESTRLFLAPAHGRSEATVHIVFPSPPSGRKTPSVIETKVAPSRAGKEDRKATALERKQQGLKDKEEKKARLLGKEACSGAGPGLGGAGVTWESPGELC